jgi:hypothetical protein
VDIKRGRVRRARSGNRSHRKTCARNSLCVACSLMKVIQYRFAAFRQVFGRNPLPHEPLFFTPALPRAVAADRHQMLAQLSEAARATGVRLDGLLEFLDLGRAPLRDG